MLNPEHLVYPREGPMISAYGDITGRGGTVISGCQRCTVKYDTGEQGKEKNRHVFINTGSNGMNTVM
jgi:hypothetical protein